MSRKTKYTAEQKLWAVHQYLNHMMSASSIASALNMSATGRNLIFTWAGNINVMASMHLKPDHLIAHTLKSSKNLFAKNI